MTPDRLTVSQHVASDHLVDPASRVLVTGCAGFIGSHVSERLVAGGCEVLGVDCFTDYYDRDAKEQNLDGLLGTPGFTLLRRWTSARTTSAACSTASRTSSTSPASPACG